MAVARAEAGPRLGETVRELREAYEGGRTRSLAWRQSQLRGLLRLLKEKEVEAFQALHKDLGKHQGEAYRDEVGRRPHLHPSPPIVSVSSSFVRASVRAVPFFFCFAFDSSSPLSRLGFLSGGTAHEVRQLRAAAARQLDGSGKGNTFLLRLVEIDESNCSCRSLL
jgi:hypothetical protein